MATPTEYTLKKIRLQNRLMALERAPLSRHVVLSIMEDVEELCTLYEGYIKPKGRE